jgi:transcriptional regulator with XRE-family HTH domain
MVELTEQFAKLYKKGDFQKIILLLLSIYSEYRLAKIIGCSRGTLYRYKLGLRNIPVSFLKKTITRLEIDEKLFLNKISETSEDAEYNIIPLKCDEQIIWFGDDNDLFNSLYFFRTHIEPMSFFQLSYKTEIAPSLLSEYECGKKQIECFDVKKILTSLNLELEELFPQLTTYDHNATYLPLKPIKSILNSNEKWYDYYLLEHDYFIQNWPINRYNSNGKIIGTAMPNELTIDEFYNTDLIFFWNGDSFYEGPDFDYNFLPPNYYRYQKLFLDSDRNSEYEIDKPEFIPAYHIEFSEENEITVFWRNDKSININLHPYIDSESYWYQQLKEMEYFRQGQLLYLDKDRLDTQVIIWPEGQYLRLDELDLDFYQQKCYYHFNSMISVGNIDNWIDWSYFRKEKKWSSELSLKK